MASCHRADCRSLWECSGLTFFIFRIVRPLTQNSGSTSVCSPELIFTYRSWLIWSPAGLLAWEITTSLALKGEQPVQKDYIECGDINSSLPKFLGVAYGWRRQRGSHEALDRQKNGNSTFSLGTGIIWKERCRTSPITVKRKAGFPTQENPSSGVRFGSIRKEMVFRAASGTQRSGFTVLQ